MSAQPITDEPRWQAEAACHGDMGSIFYPPLRGERKVARLSRERRAKALCQVCPVRAECLEWALQHNERYGIWGGLTDVERRELRQAS